MLKAANERIKVVKGDSGSFTLTLTDETGTAYVLADGESLVFMVKKKAADTAALITKTITKLTNGVATIDLTTEETGALDKGFYVYGLALKGISSRDSFQVVGDFIVFQGVVS